MLIKCDILLGVKQDGEWDNTYIIMPSHKQALKVEM